MPSSRRALSWACAGLLLGWSTWGSTALAQPLPLPLPAVVQAPVQVLGRATAPVILPMIGGAGGISGTASIGTKIVTSLPTMIASGALYLALGWLYNTLKGSAGTGWDDCARYAGSKGKAWGPDMPCGEGSQSSGVILQPGPWPTAVGQEIYWDAWRSTSLGECYFSVKYSSPGSYVVKAPGVYTTAGQAFINERWVLYTQGRCRTSSTVKKDIIARDWAQGVPEWNVAPHPEMITGAKAAIGAWLEDPANPAGWPASPSTEPVPHVTFGEAVNINQWWDDPTRDPSLDTDGDKFLDGEEAAAGTNPADPAGHPGGHSQEDNDRDGWPDWVEVREGTDPRSAASYPTHATQAGECVSPWTFGPGGACSKNAETGEETPPKTGTDGLATEETLLETKTAIEKGTQTVNEKLRDQNLKLDNLNQEETQQAVKGKLEEIGTSIDSQKDLLEQGVTAQRETRDATQQVRDVGKEIRDEVKKLTTKPEVDLAAKWSGVQAAYSGKFPLGVSSWLPQPSAVGTGNCELVNVDVAGAFGTSGAAALKINPCEGPAGQWAHDVGRPLIGVLLGVMFAFGMARRVVDSA